MSDDPEAALARYATVLADAVETALPGWVRAQVERVLADQSMAPRPEVVEAAAAAGELARAEIGAAVRRLVSADVDDQHSTPLALLRRAVAYPTVVLRAAGAAPVTRDRFATRAFPDDDYDLTPASLADLDPSSRALAEAALEWGAAKAFVHRHRHGG